MKASVLHNLMAVHPQLQQQPLMVPALADAVTGCGNGNQAASLFLQTAPPLTLFSSEQESELTCNRSRSRKRPGDAQPPLVPLSSSAICQQQQQQLLLQRQLLLLNQMQRRQANTAADVPVDSSRLNQSAMTSTSGRPPLMAVKPPFASLSNHISTATGFSSSGVISMLHGYSEVVDALVRLHAENLRSAMNDSCKRKCRAVVSAMEEEVQRRVAQKQAELDAAAKRNAELEDRLRQAKAEAQACFTFAKNSDATVAQLRASLEQALLQKLTGGKNGNNDGGNWTGSLVLPGTTAEEREGYGDSEDEATSAASAASAAAFSEQPTPMMDRVKPSVGARGSFACRSCGEADACVLLLPCRHLCLCQSCEHSVEDCPVCRSRKNASLLINLS